jgi:hypothetical protein
MNYKKNSTAIPQESLVELKKVVGFGRLPIKEASCEATKTNQAQAGSI